MLTIKQIEKNGVEQIISAESVAFFPKGDADYTGYEPRPDTTVPMVLAYNVDGTGDYNRYGKGKIFVVNEAGKTVGSYDLDHLIDGNSVELLRNI